MTGSFYDPDNEPICKRFGCLGEWNPYAEWCITPALKVWNTEGSIGIEIEWLKFDAQMFFLKNES